MVRAPARLRGALALCLALLAPGAAWAAATPWIGNARGSARLVTAVEATGSSSRLDAALELRLAPGWHTYWRTPGDAGFPAPIDWTGSENLVSADMSWPAPRRLTIEGLENIVYLDHVVLPIALAVTDPGKSVRLRAEVDYASCEKVCIPYHASLDLTLPAGLALPGPEAPLIAEAAAKVPGSLSRAGLRLLSVAMSGPDGATPSLAVTLASDAGPLMAPDLFVEGMPQATPPKPSVLHSAAGQTTSLVLPLSAETARTALGKRLTFTVVEGVRSAEFSATPMLGPSPDEGIELTQQTKARLGLDGERSWIMLGEGNDFIWPGPDLRPVAGQGPESVAYGFLPPRLFQTVRESFLARIRAKQAGLIQRTE